MTIRITLLFGSAVVLACTARPGTGAEHGGQVSGPGAGVAESDLSGWRDWTRVNAERFRSKGHGGKWVDVYLENAYVDAYRAGRSPATVGMRVVKAGYTDAAGTHFEALTVMRKMSPGYDPAHGDWYYAVLEADGRTATMQGKVDMCIHCHEQALERDYRFGVPAR